MLEFHIFQENIFAKIELRPKDPQLHEVISSGHLRPWSNLASPWWCPCGHRRLFRKCILVAVTSTNDSGLKLSLAEFHEPRSPHSSFNVTKADQITFVTPCLAQSVAISHAFPFLRSSFGTFGGSSILSLQNVSACCCHVNLHWSTASLSPRAMASPALEVQSGNTKGVDFSFVQNDMKKLSVYICWVPYGRATRPAAQCDIKASL